MGRGVLSQAVDLELAQVAVDGHLGADLDGREIRSKLCLESLGLLDAETGKAKARCTAADQRDILIATIGPTTRDYLRQEFGFTPDVCADKPSPEGIAEGIGAFLKRHE